MNILTHRGHVNSQVQIIFAGGGGLPSQGERIAQVRRLLSVIVGRDVGQKEMAEMIGVSHAFLGHMETDHRGGSKETIQKIVDVAQRYGMSYVTAGWIMFGEGEGPPILGKAPERAPSSQPKARLTRTVRKAKPAPRSDEAAKKKRG